MTPTSKRKLEESEKRKLGLAPDAKAFEFKLDKVIEERCDEFENELEFQGWEIIDREYIPVAASIFNFILVAVLND